MDPADETQDKTASHAQPPQAAHPQSQLPAHVQAHASATLPLHESASAHVDAGVPHTSHVIQPVLIPSPPALDITSQQQQQQPHPVHPPPASHVAHPVTHALAADLVRPTSALRHRSAPMYTAAPGIGTGTGTGTGTAPVLVSFAPPSTLPAATFMPVQGIAADMEAHIQQQ